LDTPLYNISANSVLFTYKIALLMTFRCTFQIC